jgi:hypothetical protein
MRIRCTVQLGGRKLGTLWVTHRSNFFSKIKIPTSLPVTAPIARLDLPNSVYIGTTARGESTETHPKWAKFQMKNISINLYNIFLMLWYLYQRVPVRWNTMLVADSRGHMCLRSSDMAEMDPNAAEMSLVGWNGYVHARRHSRQWRPGEQVLQDIFGSLVGIVSVQGCTLILKTCWT